MKQVDLYCFPFAGGNKYSYREYEQLAPKGMNIIPMEYPGRGARINEEFITHIHPLVDTLYNEIRQGINQREYAFYGHSMGGVVAFFLARKIVKNNLRPPLHLFITGTMGPSAVSREKKRHLMGREEFIEEIRHLDGCPEEVLESEELMSYFEPILRADFQVTETFEYTSEAERLNIPITVITGMEEDMPREDIYLWQNETCQPVDFKSMPGKHFFIYEHAAGIINTLSDKLSANQ